MRAGLRLETLVIPEGAGQVPLGEGLEDLLEWLYSLEGGREGPSARKRGEAEEKWPKNLFNWP